MSNENILVHLHNESVMAQLAIINYETASIEIFNLSESTFCKYANALEELVYGKMGYKPTSVYYMVADCINVCETEEKEMSL